MKGIILLLVIIPTLLIAIISCDRELSVSKPEPPPADARIEISSNPAGYSIHLDNRIMGRWTPDSMKYLEEGEHIIELKDSIYLDSTFIVNLEEGYTKEYNIDFTERAEFYGELDITTYPINANIFINDSSTGLTSPYKFDGLYPGMYKVSFTQVGYRAPDYYMLVKSNENTDCLGVLEDTTIWLDYTVDNSSIPTNSISCIDYVPGYNTDLWVGTSDKGVFIYSKGDFIHYGFEEYNLPARNILDIDVITPERVYIATSYGAAVFNGNSWNRIEGGNGFHLNVIQSIEYIAESGVVGFNYKPEKVIFSTVGEGVVEYREGSYRKYYLAGGAELPSQNVYMTAHRRYSNSVSIATMNGLLMSGPRTGDPFVLYDHTNTGFLDKNGACRVNYTAISPQGVAYAGINHDDGVGQLFYFDNGTQQWIELNIGYALVRCIYFFAGNVWVGTNNGLFRFSLDNVLKIIYRSDNSPLRSNNIFDITSDSFGDIWMATGHGLVRYRVSTENQ